MLPLRWRWRSQLPSAASPRGLMITSHRGAKRKQIGSCSRA